MEFNRHQLMSYKRRCFPISQTKQQKPIRSKGVVQYWSEKKGYGIIENDDGRDIHVYKKDLDFLTLLDIGDEIEYEIKNSKHGPKAVHVKMLKDSLFSTKT